MNADLDAFDRQRRSLFYPKADLPSLRTAADDAALRAAAATISRVAFGDVRDVAPLGVAGTFHVLYRALLADGRRVVVRLNVREEGPRDYLLFLDAWAADRLGAVGLPAVAVHRVDVSRARVPFDVAILDEAPGEPLSAFDADEERLRPLLFALGRFVARLHGVRGSGFGFPDVRPLVCGAGGGLVGTCATWRHYVLRRLEVHVECCARMGALDRDEARRVFAAFADGAALLEGVEPRLLHGDLGSHNIFVRDGEVVALIDWEDCLFGDPVYDVAFWATFHPDRRHGAFLDGYRTVRAFDDDFECRFWLYYLRVALAKTVLRQRLGLVDLPGREPATRRIAKGLERYEAARRGVRRPAAA